MYFEGQQMTTRHFLFIYAFGVQWLATAFLEPNKKEIPWRF